MEGKMTLAELQAYLDPRLQSLEKSIADKIDPVNKDVERLSKNSEQHYQEVKKLNEDFSKFRERIGERIGKLEIDVRILQDDKTDSKFESQLKQAKLALMETKKGRKTTIVIFAIGLIVSNMLSILLPLMVRQV